MDVFKTSSNAPKARTTERRGRFDYIARAGILPAPKPVQDFVNAKLTQLIAYRMMPYSAAEWSEVVDLIQSVALLPAFEVSCIM